MGVSEKKEKNEKFGALGVPLQIRPAGMKQLAVADAANIPIPKELQGKGLKFEEFDSSLPPTIMWETPGDSIVGIFSETQVDVGPNNSNLHMFSDYKTGKVFAIWGSWALDKLAPKLNSGDLVQITYTGEVPIEGKNPCRQYFFRVGRK